MNFFSGPLHKILWENLLDVTLTHLVLIELYYFDLCDEVSLHDNRFLHQKNLIVYFVVWLNTRLEGQVIINPKQIVIVIAAAFRLLKLFDLLIRV